MCIGGKRNTPANHSLTHQPMTNTELTLDQLKAVSGGATAIEYGLIAALDTGSGNDRIHSNLDTGSGNDRLRIKKF